MRHLVTDRSRLLHWRQYIYALCVYNKYNDAVDNDNKLRFLLLFCLFSHFKLYINQSIQ